jgi:hypothetical protein
MHHIIRSIGILVLLFTGACAAPESARAVRDTHAAASAELARAWAADHALARAMLGTLVEIRRITLRGAIHRELIATGCITPGDAPRADAAAFGALLADPASDIALVREVRLGRMAEADAIAWLHDYAAALALSDSPANDATRAAMVDRLAPVEHLHASAAALGTALDARAARIAALAAETSAATESLASAIDSRTAWRTIGAEIASPENLDGAIDGALAALFPDPSDAARRAAARELLTALLGSVPPL